MSLICVKEGARKTFKIIESVLKTECFPVSARRGQNELNCIVNCTTYMTGTGWKMLCLEIKDDLFCYRSNARLQYHFIGERISSTEFFEN